MEHGYLTSFFFTSSSHCSKQVKVIIRGVHRRGCNYHVSILHYSPMEYPVTLAQLPSPGGYAGLLHALQTRRSSLGSAAAHTWWPGGLPVAQPAHGAVEVALTITCWKSWRIVCSIRKLGRGHYDQFMTNSWPIQDQSFQSISEKPEAGAATWQSQNAAGWQLVHFGQDETKLHAAHHPRCSQRALDATASAVGNAVPPRATGPELRKPQLGWNIWFLYDVISSISWSIKGSTSGQLPVSLQHGFNMKPRYTLKMAGNCRSGKRFLEEPSRPSKRASSCWYQWIYSRYIPHIPHPYITMWHIILWHICGIPHPDIFHHISHSTP